MFKEFDKVMLKSEFENNMVFVVADTRKEKTESIVTLFPLRGGMCCAANQDNLNQVLC